MPDDWPRDAPLTLEGVHARRGGVAILQGIDLDFPPGSRTVILGPSGSGKSTLLRLLNRLADPSEGVIRIGDRPQTSFPVTLVRRRIGLVFQSPRPLPGTVAENLDYPRRLGTAQLSPPAKAPGGAPPHPNPLPQGEREPEKPATALSEVGLDPAWLDRDAAGLSGGERQRLMLAVALRTDPAILALDEPTSALDPAAARVVANLLRERSERQGLTTIAVTHSREHAAWLGDRAVILEAGRVADQGPLDDVLARADASIWADGSGGSR